MSVNHPTLDYTVWNECRGLEGVAMKLATSQPTTSEFALLGMKQHRPHTTLRGALLVLALLATMKLLWTIGVQQQQSWTSCSTTSSHNTWRASVHSTAKGGYLSAATGVHNADEAWPSPLLYTAWKFKGVQHPHTAEGDIALVPLCSASFTEHHPLTASDYQRSYRSGHPCNMPPGLLQKIQAGEPVKITVVGGSMTQGLRCYDGKRIMQACAWSRRLQDRLRETFPQANITVHNAALRGFSYGQWVVSGMFDGLVDTDVAIIDEQANSHVSVGN